MASNSSLGIYVENNLIKYAKVVKEKDSLKVEAFNLFFYDDLGEALRKVISETYSSKVPICMNISNELYNYYDVFAMLNKNDMKKSVEIEFDMMCNEKNYNKSSLESRFVLMSNRENTEKMKVLHISANKADINRKRKEIGSNKVTAMVPISTSITNLLNISSNDNIAIVNIEEETKVTIIMEGQIYRVDTIEAGMGQILNEINTTENSLSKSYEVCKNVTIYNQDSRPFQNEDSEHLEEIMPILYKIVTESKKIIDSSFATITKLYITGLGTAINNIDLYFQEYMVNLKCEILHPFFVESSSVKIPVKDYIEVNSAIALAMEGLGYGNKELNFITEGFSLGNIDVGQIFKSFKSDSLSSGGGMLDVFERSLARLCVTLAMIIVVYVVFSNVTMKQINAKKDEVTLNIRESNSQLAKLREDASVINSRIQTYQIAIDNINDLSSDSDSTKSKRIIAKDAIPNLLNKIMFIIPQKVVITSIRNSEEDHIVIEAQAEKYEQLGYFKALITSKGLLEEVKSTSGTKEGNIVRVTIEGDLP